ncbi:hypothetical protein OH77DRAFT_1525544 [Trametes cingulata]|nr:hypothetical protein OH77DRAFT_1525544 [Trametes cingulata]
MPDDCWATDWMGQEPDERARRRLYLTRELRASDFDRLKLYAPRVRRVLLDEECRALPPRARLSQLTLLADTVLEALTAHFPLGTLLPRLQILHQAHLSSPLHYRALAVLAGPHLRNLSDQMIGHVDPDLAREDSEFCRALAALKERSPGMRFFQLYASVRCYAAMDRAVSDALCGFGQLQHVSLEQFPITPRALAHLAGLPSLYALEVWVQHTDYSAVELDESGGPDNETPFPALRVLSLTQGQPGLAACTSALACIRPPCLRSVTVTSTSYMQYSPADEIPGVLRLLGAPPLCESLRSVTLEVVNGCVRSGDELPAAALRPLLQLANLEMLDLDVRCLVAADDALLHAMSKAWPRLAHLRLGTEHPPPRIPRPPPATLAGLLGFAHRSPALRSLGLHVRTDVQALPRLLREVRPGRGAVHRGLESLGVGRSHLAYEDVLPVAAFLSDVFPGLVEVECAWAFADDEDEDDDGALEDGEEDGDEAARRRRDPHGAERRAEARVRRRWNRVHELIPVFERVREQERKWAVRHGQRILTPADAGL